MLKSMRQEQILDLLRSNGVVEVGQLSKMFSVAEATIRRDLDELAEKDEVERTHGGAVLAKSKARSEAPLEARLARLWPEKEAISTQALSLIREGQNIFLDSGSTTFCMAKEMDNSKRLVVVTNALNVATELNSRSNISVISVGGDLRKKTLSCVGHFAEEMIKQLSLDVAFLGVGGINNAGDMSEISTSEVGVKRAVMQAAKQVVVLADHSKIGRSELAQTANLRDVDHLVTDKGTPSDVVAHYREMGVQIHVTEPSHPSSA